MEAGGFSSRDHTVRPPLNVVILCIGVKVLPWANREPTVTKGYPVRVWSYRHENGDGEAYTLKLDQHVF